MLTLSAANQSNIRDRNQQPAVIVDFPNLSYKISNSNNVTDAEPDLVSVSDIVFEMEPWGGLGKWSEVTVVISPQYGGANEVIKDNEFTFEEMNIILKYGTDADIPLWGGIVDNWSYDNGMITILGVTVSDIAGLQLPTQQINTTNFTTENIPSSSLHRWVPFTFGSPYRPIGIPLDFGANASTAQVIFNSAVTGHAAIGSLTTDPAFWVLDLPHETWWRENATDTSQTDSGNLTSGRLDFDRLSTWDDILLELETSIIPSRVLEWSGATSLDNALDGSTGTFALLDNPAADNTTTGAEFRALMPEFTNKPWKCGIVKFLFKVEKENAVNHGTRTAEKFHVALEIIEGTTPDAVDQTLIISSGTSYNNVDGAEVGSWIQLVMSEYFKAWGFNVDGTGTRLPVNVLSGSIINVECIEEDQAGGGDESDYFRIYYIALNLDAYVPFPLNHTIHGNLTGYDDDSSGTYTGTANSLIETPSDFIHFLLGEIWSISDINTTSISDARTDYGSYIISGQLFALTEAETFLQELAFQSRMIGPFVDAAGDWKIRYWDEADTADDTLEEKDILLDGDKVDIAITNSPSDEIINQFDILYGWSEAQGRYLNTLAYDESSGGAIGTWLTDSQSTWNITKRRTFEAKYINDDDTATSWGNWLIYQYADRHRMVNFSTSWRGVAIELGDRLTLDHPFIDNVGDKSNDLYLVYKKTVQPMSGTIKCEAVQVDLSHSVLTDPT